MGVITPIPSVNGNGARIPLLGLGIWDLRGRTCARMVEEALRLGYRNITPRKCTTTSAK
jgi:diketogulonate reductase-like aldo/keto reductase